MTTIRHATLMLCIVLAAVRSHAFSNLDPESYTAIPQGFEPSGWSHANLNVNGVERSADTRPGTSGSWSFRMNFSKEGFNQAEYYQQGAVSPGSQVTLRAWIKTLPGVWYGQGRIALTDGAAASWVQDAPSGWMYGGWHYNTGSWTEASVGPLTVSGSTVTIWIKGEGNWGEALFDDVSVEIAGGDTPTRTPTTGPGVPTNTPTRTLTATATLAPAQGLLRNPGFEEGFTDNIGNGWEPYRDGFYENAAHLAGNDHASEGAFSQKLQMPVVPIQLPDRKFGVYQRVRVRPGESYTASMDFRTYLPGEAPAGDDLVCVIGIDPYGDTVPNPHATRWSVWGGSNAWSSLQVTSVAIEEYVTVFCLSIRKWPRLGTGWAWMDDVSLIGPAPATFTPTVTGTLPTSTPTVTPTPTPPAVVGPELVANGDFEGNFSGGVAAGWQKWQTAGSAESFWKRSTLAGPVGAGVYGGTAGWQTEIVNMNPKVMLLDFDYGSSAWFGSLPGFEDTVIIGRLFIDQETYDWMYNPDLSDEDIVRNCREILVNGNGGPSGWLGIREMAARNPRIDIWTALNEPGVDTDYGMHRHTLWEKTMTEACRELGIKTLVLNLAVGNPGNPRRMFDPEMQDLLATADYVGYHTYGGPNDQLMIKRYLDGNNLDDPYDFALRWRTYVEAYRERGWRMPPVIYTEGTTYGGWRTDPNLSQPLVVEDLILFMDFINSDPWALGLTIFCSGSGPEWMGWNIAGTGLGAQVGPANLARPVDKADGLYSQQFGMGKVHPLTAYTHPGLFTGGIVQRVEGLVPGRYYRLRYAHKYEFRGMPPQLSLHHGLDHSGQTDNPNSRTIHWSEDLVALGRPLETHEVFHPREEVFQAYSSAVSVWMKASHPAAQTSFQVTVDAVSLRQIDPEWVPPGDTPAPPPTATATPPGIDTDQDGIPDALEGGRAPSPNQSNAYLPDSDGDGLDDGTEDTNRNGSPNPGETHTRYRDTDSDQYEDGIEAGLGWNPLSPASPGTPLLDADNDALPDAEDPNPASRDTDGDRFLDSYEWTVLGASAVSSASVKPGLGDVDGNLVWDNADAQLVLGWFASLPVSIDFTRGDPDRNGYIDNGDAQGLLNYFARITDVMPE